MNFPKKIIVVLLAIFALASVNLAFAQNSNEQNNNQNNMPGRARVTNQVTTVGTIVSVDTANSSFVIRFGTRNVTVILAQNAKITNLRGQTITINDLKVGDRISITGTVTKRISTTGRISVVTATTVRILSR